MLRRSHREHSPQKKIGDDGVSLLNLLNFNKLSNSLEFGGGRRIFISLPEFCRKPIMKSRDFCDGRIVPEFRAAGPLCRWFLRRRRGGFGSLFLGFFFLVF